MKETKVVVRSDGVLLMPPAFSAYLGDVKDSWIRGRVSEIDFVFQTAWVVGWGRVRRYMAYMRT